MIQNSPTIRRVLYIALVVAGVAAIALKPVGGQWAEAAQEVAAYLAGISGVTAALNVSGRGVESDEGTG